MAYGWEGELIRLVPLDKERHLDNATRWMNDPEITQWLLVGDFPLTRIAEEAYFDARTKDMDRDIAFAIETLEGAHIGFSGLHKIDFRHGTAQSGTFIGLVDQWGKGYGTDAAKVRLRYFFDVLGLRMVTSGYLAGNDRSQRMLTKAGYKEYGRLPNEFWKRGAYRDHVMMYIDRNMWAESLGVTRNQG